MNCTMMRAARRDEKMFTLCTKDETIIFEKKTVREYFDINVYKWTFSQLSQYIWFHHSV